MFPPLSRPRSQIRGSMAYVRAECPAKLTESLLEPTMQNRTNQKHTVSNDAYQPFLRQYYRMGWGKKQWNIKKPSQSRTVPPTSPRGAGLLHRGLRVPISRSPTQAKSADLQAKAQRRLRPLRREHPDCRQRCRLTAD